METATHRCLQDLAASKHGGRTPAEYPHLGCPLGEKSLCESNKPRHVPACARSRTAVVAAAAFAEPRPVRIVHHYLAHLPK